MQILTVSQFGQQIKWPPHLGPKSFWVLNKVTHSYSLSLQDQCLLQPNKDLSPSSFFFSGVPKGERWRRQGLPRTKPGCSLSPLPRHRTPSRSHSSNIPLGICSPSCTLSSVTTCLYWHLYCSTHGCCPAQATSGWGWPVTDLKRFLLSLRDRRGTSPSQVPLRGQGEGNSTVTQFLQPDFPSLLLPQALKPQEDRPERGRDENSQLIRAPSTALFTPSPCSPDPFLVQVSIWFPTVAPSHAAPGKIQGKSDPGAEERPENTGHGTPHPGTTAAIHTQPSGDWVRWRKTVKA